MRRPPYATGLVAALSLALLTPLSMVAPASAEPDAPAAAVATEGPAESLSDDPTVEPGEDGTELPEPTDTSLPVEEPALDPTEEAEETLESVEDLLGESGASTGQDDEDDPADPADPADEQALVEEGRDLTLELRDLAAENGELTGSDRRAAAGYLARPDDDDYTPFGVKYAVDEAAPTCEDDVCVHRVDTTADRATSEYAQRVHEAVQLSHDTYVGAGYRAPKSDRGRGGNTKVDVYLADIGDDQVYGFCATDDYRRSTSAYCVLDNDYRSAQFPRLSPTENMKVTAAHEYFHAVQFGYDAREDLWFMEGTATWAEDEVFDDINDNVGYLDQGPMRRAAYSLDLDNGGLEIYGTWSFFRYVSERFPRTQGEVQGGMPTVVRRMWERADSTRGPRQYSLQAVRGAVGERGVALRDVFADYAAANRHPAKVYDEGRANDYPRARLEGGATLSRDNRTARRSRTLNHLTSSTLRIRPDADLRGKRWAVRLKLDLANLGRGSEVRVTAYRTNGSINTTEVRLNRQGEARVRRPFSASSVRAVEVHLVNASSRIRCRTYGPISCSGTARDDRLRANLVATLVSR